MDMLENMACQGKELFQRIATVFQEEGFRASDIVRQWNYIGHITETENGMQHYQAFNEARARFYKSSDDWHERGYPAATGIGMSIQGLIISLIASIGTTPEVRILPIDNPLQVAAHHYSQAKLVGDEQQERATISSGMKDTAISIPLATPKFERGKILLNQQSGLCYVSGTAAIRGEESMHSLNAELQTRQTIENINFLISEENLRPVGITDFVTTFVSLRVYFKNKEDAEVIQAEVEKQWAGIPVVYMQADICRKELLVEIEGVARLEL
jgi:enamine deaminase RidA (YjgF/YER057c/UK114 family)